MLITGASGGIGSALALEHAAPGRRLILHGRDEGRLGRVAARCEALGARVQTVVLELRHTERLREWASRLASDSPPDLLLVNAGVNSTPAPDGAEPWSDVEAVLDVNVRSSVALVEALLPTFRARRSGQIGLVCSLAAYVGLPVRPAYSASKAALKAYGEGLRGSLAPFGVEVSVIMPGYVQSAMCDATPGPKPMIWSAERAAARIRKGLARNEPRIAFPWPLSAGLWLLSVLPPDLALAILRHAGHGSR
ncbi:MAG TPA: SDR family NAD(P)-dependent oxidoreductase [Usitatibacter sp.]|nr:SDR family NAD(P)-dependent oxidoreductase [Usitatibacter sp.]